MQFCSFLESKFFAWLSLRLLGLVFFLVCSCCRSFCVFAMHILFLPLGQVLFWLPSFSPLGWWSLLFAVAVCYCDFFGLLGHRLLTFDSWSLLFLRLVLVHFGNGLSLLWFVPFCLHVGFLYGVAFGLLVHLLPFGRLPALLVVCLLIFAACFGSLRSDVISRSPGPR